MDNLPFPIRCSLFAQIHDLSTMEAPFTQSTTIAKCNSVNETEEACCPRKPEYVTLASQSGDCWDFSVLRMRALSVLPLPTPAAYAVSRERGHILHTSTAGREASHEDPATLATQFASFAKTPTTVTPYIVQNWWDPRGRQSVRIIMVSRWRHCKGCPVTRTCRAVAVRYEAATHPPPQSFPQRTEPYSMQHGGLLVSDKAPQPASIAER
ncbi:hypothetical protein HDV57DRAFT_117549 [Trichoderma longibrachiatum]